MYSIIIYDVCSIKHLFIIHCSWNHNNQEKCNETGKKVLLFDIINFISSNYNKLKVILWYYDNNDIQAATN